MEILLENQSSDYVSNEFPQFMAYNCNIDSYNNNFNCFFITNPDSFCFAHHQICMFPQDVTKPTRYIIQELSKYMTELSVCVYSFVKFKASSKAFACVLVAIDSLDDDSVISMNSKNIFVSTYGRGYNAPFRKNRLTLTFQLTSA